MAIQTTTFKGARYIVKFHDPIEWADTESYEAIEAVQHEAFTYISKQPVPAGVQIDNDDFWLLWADPNAQMEELRQLVAGYVEDVGELSGIVEQWSNELQAEIDNIEKARAFETVTNMKQGTNLVVGAICHTNGFHTSGDGGSAWYEIIESLPEGMSEPNEMDYIACGNLFAKLIYDNQVDVKQLGATQETDCSDIIARAIEIATDAVYMPNGTYNIDETITVNKDIDFICEGSIIASSNCLPALLFESVNDRKIEIDSIEYESASYDYIENSYLYRIGTVLKNCTNNDVKINRFENCTCAFMLFASGGNGCHYNEIDLHILDTCYHGCVFITNDETSWVNGNHVKNMTAQFHTWSTPNNAVAYLIMLRSFSSGTPYANNGNRFDNINFEYNVANGSNVKLIYADYQNMSEFNFTRIESTADSMQTPFDIQNTCTALRMHIQTTINAMSFPEQGLNNNYAYANEQRANATYEQLNKIDLLNNIELAENVAFRTSGSITKSGFSCAIADFVNKKVILHLQLQTSSVIPANTVLVKNITSPLLATGFGPFTRIVVPIIVQSGTSSSATYDKTVLGDINTSPWPIQITTREEITYSRMIDIDIEIPMNRL